jgi:hypothetical protein
VTKTYIVALSPPLGGETFRIENFVRQDPMILAYWNYLPLVYCVKTDASADQLASKLRSVLPVGYFLVAEIDQANMNGALPREAWDWFKTDHAPHFASFGSPPPSPFAPFKG